MCFLALPNELCLLALCCFCRLFIVFKKTFWKDLQIHWRRSEMESFFGKVAGNIKKKIHRRCFLWVLRNFSEQLVSIEHQVTSAANVLLCIEYFVNSIPRIFYKIRPLFMGGVQLPQGYRATTRKDERLSRLWSHPVVLWEPNALTIRSFTNAPLRAI